MSSIKTIAIEDQHMVPFFTKIPISIVRGEGVYVWDEEGNQYLDFTSGWGVTCIGHAHPDVLATLQTQGAKILQNPNSGLTYSPARAELLALLHRILPENLTHTFFSNSGAEANDAALKLARKVTCRPDVISTNQSFHGRTISTASATGQGKHRDKFNPLMPNNRFVPYGDVDAIKEALDENSAAVILEPIQGEGGVRVPSGTYLKQVESLCKANGSLLIIDEIQTGFARTGPMFVTQSLNVNADILTMAKGIGGGFPIGAFSMTTAVAQKIEKGDHGGTYCGNPLGCAVAHTVIKYLVDNNIPQHVEAMGTLALKEMHRWKSTYPESITDIRGSGLLLLIEFKDEATATKISDECLAQHLFVRQTQGNGIRIFPALNIKKDELHHGLKILEQAISTILSSDKTAHSPKTC